MNSRGRVQDTYEGRYMTVGQGHNTERSPYNPAHTAHTTISRSLHWTPHSFNISFLPFSKRGHFLFVYLRSSRRRSVHVVTHLTRILISNLVTLGSCLFLITLDKQKKEYPLISTNCCSEGCSPPTTFTHYNESSLIKTTIWIIALLIVFS